jgi:NADH:ubiquinone oxidoreductase subunit 3 (subunit A)
MNFSIIFSPFGAFTIFLCLSLLLFLLGGVMAPKRKIEAGKEKMYACGEDFPAKKFNPTVTMIFHVGLFYTIMEVCALTLATLPNGNAAILGLVYLAGISISVAALILR